MSSEAVPSENPTVVGEPVATLPVDQPSKKLGQWPEWYGTLDFALALLVAGLAFLVATFAVTNSDYWLHIATGRALLDGNYTLGSDPFTFSGAERVWVNHAWLSDLLMLAAHSASPDGAVAVVLKAVMVALAVGLLFLLRQPGQALLPWAFFGLLGLLASAPLISARPAIVSMLFLSLTMVIVHRTRWMPGSWRQPLILAGLFFVWVNCDDWFWLGPLYLVIVTLGEGWLDRWLTGEKRVDQETLSVFPPVPPTGCLLKALGLGLIACLLNPTFLIAMTQSPIEALTQSLPSELIVAIPASSDSEAVGLGHTALLEDFYYNAKLGVRLNGVAFAALFILGTLSLLGGFRRLRATHILLWVSFGMLPLLQLRLIPYFVLVAVPIAAGHLNGLSHRLRLGPTDQARTKLTLLGSMLARLFLLVALIGMVPASYPGWLNYLNLDRAKNKRLEWTLRPDAAMVRTAEVLRRWTEAEQLPEGSRGVNSSSDFGDYAAWFAPKQKMFINSRPGFHRHELPKLLEVRATVLEPFPETPTTPKESVAATLKMIEADYVVAASTREGMSLPSLSVFETQPYGTLWYLDGHALIVGLPSSEVGSGLKFNPETLAYAPDVEPVPATTIQAPLKPDPDSYELYALQSDPLPIAAADTQAYLAYKALRENDFIQELRAQVGMLGGPALWVVQGELPLTTEPTAIAPLTTLALRAARRAVAQAPDRHEGYISLFDAYSRGGAASAPVLDTPYLSYAVYSPFRQQFDELLLPERIYQQINAGTRVLDRLPPPEMATPSEARQFCQIAEQLMSVYVSTKQYDRARDTLRRLIAYFKSMNPYEAQPLFDTRGTLQDSEELLKVYNEQLDRLKKAEIQYSNLIVKANQTARSASDKLQELSAAIGLGAPMTAIELFNEVKDKNEAYGPQAVPVSFLMVMLQLRAGQLYEATLSLDGYEEEIEKIRQQSPDSAEVRIFTQLRGLQARLAGDYAAAQQAMDQIVIPKMTEEQIDEIKRNITTQRNSIGMVLGAPFYLFDPRRFRDPYTDVVAEANYQYDRALLAISSGDMPEAYRRLRLARKPNGFDLAKINPSLTDEIERYLTPIERVRESAK